MFEELVKCADLMTQFGGHPMAAGLSMEEKNVEEFRRRFNENCTLTEEDLRPKCDHRCTDACVLYYKRTGRTDFAFGALWEREYKTGLCAEKSQSA